MKKWLASVAAAACLSSCIYPFTPDLPSSYDRTVVVEGRILIGGISTIQLSYVTPLDQYRPDMPVGQAYIEDNAGNIYRPAEGGGFYFNFYSTQDIPHSAASSVTYRAVVQADGETYVSDWIAPDPAPTIDAIHFSADNASVYVTVDLDPGRKNTGYLGCTFQETWRFHAEIYPEYFIDPQTWVYGNYLDSGIDYPYYWCWRTFSPGYIFLFDYRDFEEGPVKGLPLFSFSRADTRNHQRYSILVTAFALSREAYDYNKQIQELADIGGDLFSPEPGALVGNLRCESNPDLPVMGMVLAAETTQKRAFVNSSRYLISRAPSVVFEQVKREDMPRFYRDGYRPSILVDFEDGSDIGWVHVRCIDCIQAGGTQERPDFWED